MLHIRDKYLPTLFLFPSLNIHFVRREEPKKNGSLAWSAAPDCILSAGLSHTRAFPHLHGHKHSLILSFRAAYRASPSPNAGKHSHSSFCSGSAFSQQPSLKLLNITSRVRRDNGSHVPLKPKIALAVLQILSWVHWLQTHVPSADKLRLGGGALLPGVNNCYMP